MPTPSALLQSGPSVVRLALRPRRAPRTSNAGIAALGALSALFGCVFTPPPPLPGELAEQEAEQAQRAAAVNGGTPFDPDEQGEGGAGQEDAGGAGDDTQTVGSGFAKGDPPALGMSPEQMKAYATAQGDPHGGSFTLAAALEGLPGDGVLVAELYTTQGLIACELFEDRTPLTVANFVGLARGKRAALDPGTGDWETRNFFDGTLFHRVIPGFMIQGGDPTGTGRGEVGYVIPDELDDELLHDRPGILSMANRGPGTGNTQFFITLAPTPHLDGRHTVFGACDDAGVDAAEHIAAMRGPSDRPTTPQLIEKVEIVRR